MKKCTQCGRMTMRNDQEFCSKCGAEFQKVVKEYPHGTIEGGLQAMAEDDFSEGMMRWIAAVRKGPLPDDEEYSGMIDAAADCVIRHVPDARYYSRDGVADLAIELMGKRNVMEDLMSALAAALPRVRSRRQMSRLAAEYMFLALNSYNVYPDIRYMVRLLKKAHADMAEFKKALPEMVGEDKGEERELRFYVEHTAEMADRINFRVQQEGRERLQFIVSYWTDQPYLAYAQIAIDAAKKDSKARGAKNFSDMRTKGSKAKTDEFLDFYFGQPFRPMKGKGAVA